MTLRVLVKTIINGLFTGSSWRKETLKTGGRCAILYGMYTK